MVSKVRYEPPKCSYTVVGPRIKTDGSVLNKVSGTMVGGILGLSPWATPFSVACDLLGLGRQDVSDKPAVKTGKVLESKIIDYLGETYKDEGMFLPAEAIFDKREGEHNRWTPDWEDDVFTGHIDGAVIKEDGETYILEVKTSANMAAWMDGVPEYYFWQVALYNHFLTQQDKAYVALGIVDQETHKDPEAWVPSESNTALFEVDIDQDAVAAKLEEIREWYTVLKKTHTTPMYDMNRPSTDIPLYTHLMDLATDAESMTYLVDEVGVLEAQISKKLAEIDHLQTQKDALRARLKDYLEGNELPELQSQSGEYFAVMGKQTRRRISAEKLRDAGIDPEPFTETTVTNTFTIKTKTEIDKKKEKEE